MSATTRYPSRAGGQSGAAKTSVPDLASGASTAKPTALAVQERPNNAQDQLLTDAELVVLSELKSIDSEVRLHEQAHLAQAGGLAMGGANFTYQTGPDHRRYAVGGDVQIDGSAGRTPEETLRKAQIIRAAALAPAQPPGSGGGGISWADGAGGAGRNCPARCHGEQTGAILWVHRLAGEPVYGPSLTRRRQQSKARGGREPSRGNNT